MPEISHFLLALGISQFIMSKDIGPKMSDESISIGFVGKNNLIFRMQVDFNPKTTYKFDLKFWNCDAD